MVPGRIERVLVDFKVAEEMYAVTKAQLCTVKVTVDLRGDEPSLVVEKHEVMTPDDFESRFEWMMHRASAHIKEVLKEMR